MSAGSHRARFAARITAVLTLSSAPALADITKEQCIEANGKGQELRRDGRLTAAREQLRSCANSSCPALVRQDCTKRLDELEMTQPTIIFEAKDASGRDVGAVKVAVDGHPLAEKLDGTALRVDPGEHLFAFAVPGQPPITQTFIIREGEKERREPLVIGSPVAAPLSQTSKRQRQALEPPAPSPAQAAPSAAGSSKDPGGTANPWRAVGWVLGGAGVAGLGVGTVFGVLTLGDKSSAHCNAANVCDRGTVGGIRSAALISDVGWIAGGILFAGGVALVLLAPSTHHDPAAGVRVSPVVTASGADIMAEGRW